MRKVIKIILGIISAVILTLLVIPVTVWLLLLIPSVQNFAVYKAAQFASDKLETRVSIDRVDIKLISRAVIEGFYVEDHNGDTLLYAGHIDAGIRATALLRGKISFRDIELADVVFAINQNADSTTNLKNVVERLRREEPRVRDTPFSLSARSVNIRDMNFRLRKYTVRDRGPGTNFDDLDIRRLNVDLGQLAIIGDSVITSIQSITFHEKNGFVLNKLESGTAIFSGRGMVFSDLRMQAEGSDLQVDHIRFSYSDWQDMGEFVEKVHIDGRLRHSTVAFATIGWFVPSLFGNQLVLTDIDAQASGMIQDLNGQLRSLRTGSITSVSTVFAMTGIPDIKNTRFTAQDLQLRTRSADISGIVTAFKGGLLPQRQEQMLDNLGTIVVNGNVDGSLTDFTARITALTDIGNADAGLSLKSISADEQSVNATVSTWNFNLGALLGAEKLGHVNLWSTAEGRVEDRNLDAVISASIGRLEYNDYTYRGIDMAGLVHNRYFKGNIHGSDDNLAFDFNGLLDFNDSLPRYDFALDLANADLFALNFNRRDSISTVQTRLAARGTGFDPDIINADIDISSLTYINHLDTLTTENIRLIGRNNDQIKYLAMRSEFTDAEFRSRLSYRTMYEYFTNTLYRYLPSLSDGRDTAHVHRTAAGISEAGGYSILSVNVKQTDNLAKIFMPGLLVSEGSNLQFTFNPEVEKFTFALNAEYIEKDNFYVSNLAVNSLNQDDSISVYLRAEEIYASGLMIPAFSMIAGARDNQIYAGMHFADEKKGRNALIGLNASLGRDAGTGIPQVSLRTTPSHITNGDMNWNLYARAVADTNRITVRNFVIEGDGQYLRSSGVISAERSDTLHIDLRNFDLAALTQFTEGIGYTIGGKTNGHADIAAVKKDGLLHADIQFDSVTVNGLRVPDSNFESMWDFERERARFLLTERASSDTVVRGYFRPSDRRYFARARFDGLDISVLDPFFDGILSDTHGSALVQAEVSGTGGDVAINGTVAIPKFTTRIDFLNVGYEMNDAEIVFTDNVMRLKPNRVTDVYGNTADIKLEVDMRSFRNIGYDIEITPDNLLVMNTDRNDNDMFYGKVFASGGAAIKGDRRGITMDISATTSGASEFFMTLNDYQDISDADFITFVNPLPPITDSTGYGARKRSLIARNTRMKRVNEAAGMDINMRLAVQPNLTFNFLIDPLTNHSIAARGTGNLTLNLNPRTGDFSMIGDYEISDGIYNFSLENLIRKEFVIEPGSIMQWTGDPLGAMLNISATYRLKTSLRPIMSMAGYTDDALSVYSVRVPIDCKIQLTEELYQPLITFDIEAPTVESEVRNVLANVLNTQEMMASQFFFLLATNSFMAQDTGSQGIIGINTGSETAFEFLSNQLSNWISTDKFNIGVKYRPGNSGVTSDEFSIDYSQELFSNRLLIEMEGNYDVGNSPTMRENTKNFTGDFFLTWLIDENGNLKAKFFTRTIDRFDENQGLQETGFGLYYNEYFNTGRDIITNLRNRFTGARRRERQRAQEEADKLEAEMMRRESELDGIMILYDEN